MHVRPTQNLLIIFLKISAISHGPRTSSQVNTGKAVGSGAINVGKTAAEGAIDVPSGFSVLRPARNASGVS